MKNDKGLWIIFLCLINLGHCFNGFSQDLSPAENLDSILIQNQRIQIPFSDQNRGITLISQKVISQLPVQNVSDLLGYISGVDIRRRGAMGTQTDISINGGTFDQTLILVNGIKIIDPQTGHNMMNLPVNLSDIKRIEILTGPAAGMYGINAINGAINIVTHQPSKTEVRAHIYSGSSFQKDTTNNKLYAGIGAEISMGMTTDISKHYLSAGTIQSNGYRYNTDVSNQKIFTDHQIFLNEHELRVFGGYTSNDFGANGFFAAPNDREANETVQTTLAAITGKFKVNEIWDLKPSISYRYGTDHFLLNKQKPELYENLHYTHSFDAELNNTFQLSKGVLGLGLEYRNTQIYSNSLGDHSRPDFGFFGNYSLNFISKTLINFGLYTNYNKDYGWQWMPSVDFGYSLLENLRIYTSAGTGMRLPTYTDLYYQGPTNIGNPDLKPEKAFQWALGAKYHKKDLRISGEYFYKNTRDLIDWVKDSVEQPWTTLNYQGIKTSGLTLALDYPLLHPRQNPAHHLNFHLS